MAVITSCFFPANILSMVPASPLSSGLPYILLLKTTMVAKKEKAEYVKQMIKLNQIRNKVEYQQENISRSDPHGGYLLKKKMRNIKAMEKRINNTELTKVPDYEDEINLFFNDVYIPNNKIIIDYENVCLKMGSRVLINNLNLTLSGSKHIVIIGKNGIGKTCLLKKIYDDLKIRDDIKIGYMSQNYDDILDNSKTPIEYLSNSTDKKEISWIRSLLGNIKFTHEEATLPIHYLSGGSKAKLILMKLIYSNCNVLILDEPTRNVSVLSNPVIRNCLKEYQGAIISVSHDRKYISDCDRVYEIAGGQFKNI